MCIQRFLYTEPWSGYKHEIHKSQISTLNTFKNQHHFRIFDSHFQQDWGISTFSITEKFKRLYKPCSFPLLSHLPKKDGTTYNLTRDLIVARAAIRHSLMKPSTSTEVYILSLLQKWLSTFQCCYFLTGILLLYESLHKYVFSDGPRRPLWKDCSTPKYRAAVLEIKRVSWKCYLLRTLVQSGLSQPDSFYISIYVTTMCEVYIHISFL